MQNKGFAALAGPTAPALGPRRHPSSFLQQAQHVLSFTSFICMTAVSTLLSPMSPCALLLLHAPQILVELADLQDQEVGDGTTSVVILAAELLKRANDLVRAKIHPTSIISGYRLAMREVRAREGQLLGRQWWGVSGQGTAVSCS